MSTDVVHGPHPRFEVPIKPGDSYQLTITGYYTELDEWTAAGVTDRRWNSQNPTKRKPELLGLRSAFIDWFLIKWVECGGSFDEGVHQVEKYPFENHRLRVGQPDPFET